uniref:Uncharacterized protein n=1 Tax=Arundo donax TaxID=35708 RepID=A0A0A9D9R5_ARUDO
MHAATQPSLFFSWRRRLRRLYPCSFDTTRCTENRLRSEALAAAAAVTCICYSILYCWATEAIAFIDATPIDCYSLYVNYLIWQGYTCNFLVAFGS